MKTLKILLIIVFLAMAHQAAPGQKLSIVRTDVDSTRAHFVTAKYIFGIDIYAEDVENSNGVSFELRFNQTDYIKFSEYKIGNFGPKGELHLMSLVNKQTGEGRIIVGAGTGNPLGPGGISNPKIVHLEFAVLQNAPYHETEPHYDQVTFYFVNPKATVFIDSIPQSIELETEPFSFDMHGYINVWPGDADNNGKVNSDDYNRVLFYLGLGANTKSMRSFKRPMASSLWVPQKVLAWDSAAATYADCDGNASITMADMLIVDHNIDKTHSKFDGSSQPPKLLGEDIEFPEEFERIPIRVSTGMSYHAAAAKVTWSDLNGEVVGMEEGDAFGKDNSRILYKINQSENSAEFSVVTGKTSINQSVNSTLAYLVVDSEDGHSLPSVNISQAYGIGEGGNIFPLSPITSVDELTEDEEISIRIIDETAELTLPTDVKLLSLYNLHGECVLSEETDMRFYSFSTDRLSPGMYFISAMGRNKVYTEKFIIIR